MVDIGFLSFEALLPSISLEFMMPFSHLPDTGTGTAKRTQRSQLPEYAKESVQSVLSVLTCPINMGVAKENAEIKEHGIGTALYQQIEGLPVPPPNPLVRHRKDDTELPNGISLLLRSNAVRSAMASRFLPRRTAEAGCQRAMALVTVQD